MPSRIVERGRVPCATAGVKRGESMAEQQEEACVQSPRPRGGGDAGAAPHGGAGAATAVVFEAERREGDKIGATLEKSD